MKYEEFIKSANDAIERRRELFSKDGLDVDVNTITNEEELSGLITSSLSLLGETLDGVPVDESSALRGIQEDLYTNARYLSEVLKRLRSEV